VVGRMGLTLHPDKTRIVRVEEGFDFGGGGELDGLRHGGNQDARRKAQGLRRKVKYTIDCLSSVVCYLSSVVCHLSSALNTFSTNSPTSLCSAPVVNQTKNSRLPLGPRSGEAINPLT